MTSLMNRFNAEPYALIFGGQSTPWTNTLEDLKANPQVTERLAQLLTRSAQIISPVASDALAITGRDVDILSYASPALTLGRAAEAAVSVPGILTAQIGVLLDLMDLGLDVRSPQLRAVLGHSQGMLAVEVVRTLQTESTDSSDEDIATILATARLIGLAATRTARTLGMATAHTSTPMLSIKGITRAQADELIRRAGTGHALRGPVSVAVQNSATHVVLSGYPADLEAVQAAAQRESAKQAKQREEKKRGGSVFTPQMEYLEVTAPFHSPLMTEAVGLVERWAKECDLSAASVERARSLAQHVLVDHVDWAADVAQANSTSQSENADALWFVDLGPGSTMAKLTTALVDGTGAGVVSAASAEDRVKLITDGEKFERTADWSRFAPRVIRTGLTSQTAQAARVTQATQTTQTAQNARTPQATHISTAFTRLTGRPPILLAGMTPTTVDAELVAAAANAGYWAEMAGGGQVTEDIFNQNMADLDELLDEGRSIEFNTMFMDRYLWNLQFGTQRIVSKKRASGAAIDGVIISAGIPEFEEGVELVHSLQADGFPYVGFKPGTVAQIQNVLRIARAVQPLQILMEVEGGLAGGHHSWESLDDMLLETYGQIRETGNVVLVVGGGIGTPERAADYMSGSWSEGYGVARMPVDGVLVGTAAMVAKEAHTSEQVKDLLVATPGVVSVPAQTSDQSADPFAPAERWVPAGGEIGGVSSGMSHLHADIYEIENASSRAGRLIAYLEKHPEELQARRAEVIEAIGQTSKPYFGDSEDMTYAQWAERFAALSFPWADPSYATRFWHLLQRVEARVVDVDHGTFISIFPSLHTVENPATAIASLREHYPQVDALKVTPADAAWLPALCNESAKPVPFVPVIDGDLLRWWGRDQLWQSEDERYSADAVRIIPGPVSVAGITEKNEKIGTILGRFEQACVQRAADEAEAEPAELYSGLQDSATPDAFIRNAPTISWLGHVMENPAYGSSAEDGYYEIRAVSDTADSYDLDIHLDTHWDGDADGGLAKHAVRNIVIPLKLNPSEPSRMPVVDAERLSEHVYAMLAGTAGVGHTAITGDEITELPRVDRSDRDDVHPYGTVRADYTFSANLGMDHWAVAGAALPENLAPSALAPDALVGPAWPAIYAALGSVYVGDMPVIEGLLNTVHLDHSIALAVSEEQLLEHAGERIQLTSWADAYEETASGRVITVHVEHRLADGTLVARQTERLAIRGRAYSSALPEPAAPYGGLGQGSADAGAQVADIDIRDTPRRLLRRVTVTAPSDMTAFARTSGDFNPIHTSVRAARVSGLNAPIVHGMWLSAVAQHAVQSTDVKGAHWQVEGWTYAMYGMVQLGDTVEVSVERVGKVARGGLVLEVTCRVSGSDGANGSSGEKTVVSVATAIVRPPVSAYVYPGQGVQSQGMVLDERAQSPAAREVWERADKVTREKLGFSILTVVRDNPTELTAKGVTYRHPEGLLNLTQFTQVALATVAFAQSARMREAGVTFEPAYFAGHSLGEYNALGAFAQIIPLETVVELVFHRGSTMHHLIERDARGRSNYRMGALRPNQFGVTDATVKQYIAQVAKESGEFLEIVNFNLAGSQYAVAGTIAGLEYLNRDASARAAAAGGKRPFMYVPGIDVPFHSTKLRSGVPEFRDKLDALLPAHMDYSVLVGRYIPNLVARPFELTKDFARSILDVVPSARIQAALDDDALWAEYAADEQKLGRLLLTELLSWQFASPVRWIETQALLFGTLGVENYVEVGLGKAPTLANMGSRTLALPDFAHRTTQVWNVGRDASRVYLTDTDADSLVPQDVEVEDAEKVAHEAPQEDVAPVSPAPVSASVSAASAEPVADIHFTAADAIATLLAFSAKIRPDQIGDADTTDTLTNGVSSKRNQLLMDISTELGVASVEGAAEASVSALYGIVQSVAPRYSAFGPVLSDAIRERLHALFGAAGVKATRIAQRVSTAWGLGEGWVAAVTAEILLATREGSSTRGGELTSLPTDAVANAAGADQLIDQAVQQVAARRGVTVSLASTSSNAAGAVVDSAALNAFAEKVTGENGVLATMARTVLEELGIREAESTPSENADAALIEAVEAELGANWVEQVSPRFDERKAILLDDRWASAREDLARIYHEKDAEAAAHHFTGLGQTIAEQARWYAGLSSGEQKDVFETIAQSALEQLDEQNAPYMHDVAVVTGVSAHSIAGEVVAGLLEGGASVIATSHSFSPAVKQWAKDVYRAHAVSGAKLWLVPANLSSFRDVDALVAWIGSEQKETHGATTDVIKPGLSPTLFFPFAAPPVHGTLADSGELFESQARLMLWGVERAIAGLAPLGADTNIAHRLHVILPGSPNRGIFGGDGAYGEVKAAFDAIVRRAQAERDWSEHVSFAHPLIGWVRGTGLMGGNDPLVDVVEERGIRTYTTAEMARELLTLCSREARAAAVRALTDASGALSVDLTGGLGAQKLDLSGLRAEAQRRVAEEGAGGVERPAQKSDAPAALELKALPTPHVPAQPAVHAADWQNVTARPEDEVVIVNIGELGTWGFGRTRLQAELGIRADGSVDLNATGVIELAWNMGLISWADAPKPGWYDADGALVPEEDIWERFHDEVVARSGIREFDDGMGADFLHGTNEDAAEIFLDHDVTFAVADEKTAREYADADAERTSVHFDEQSGEWLVTRAAGSRVHVPRRTVMTRTVGGQFPRGFDPTRWGIPSSMVEDVDPIALWNIVTAVDSFIGAGFSPAEILQAVHPSQVASTQGTGFGGMASMRKLYLERYLNKDYPSDILQEALPNVVAAHVMQSYIGGYGSMVQPVSACATAAVSVEEGYDKIRLGKADFVVAGAIDDIGTESVNGFGYMNATANSADMYAKGIDARFFSRANDRRRGGFVEAQGGGTVLLTRGDIAMKLGLPVAGVVGYVRSFADGAHTSIPAPGLGALAAAQGGSQSVLARQLGELGVSVDDIAVVSKHDTSTNANDPNESELHNTVARALGRSVGNPLYVISQKSLTGHAKGGAAVFQMHGLTDVFRTGVLPGNASLDVVDPKLERDEHMVWLRKPLRVGFGEGSDGRGGHGGHDVHGGRDVKAGLVTSLGFGHVSGFVALVHPGAFEASVRAAYGEEALEAWRTRANERLAEGARHLERGMRGEEALYEQIDNRRYREDSSRGGSRGGQRYDAHEVEKAMLLDPSARLGESGYFEK
ncbi:type I polyketide synthase [Alloscardovia macacae]|uniref:Fatty-acid synthase n=1 Tax=Alloscardovia macacae TaxID=1160091 RepID=A0A261F573_9BIFI|nr:type I polyketide synthase [Alloscardovia macacae]OZG54225.1 fatty-acid synthase [Alloscardovia macacae]